MENNKIILECYKQHKKELNKNYYKANRNVVLRKALMQRICRMQGKISEKTLEKHKITKAEIDEISDIVVKLVKEKEIQILGYDMEDPLYINHALGFVKAYYGGIRRKIDDTA